MEPPHNTKLEKQPPSPSTEAELVGRRGPFSTASLKARGWTEVKPSRKSFMIGGGGAQPHKR